MLEEVRFFFLLTNMTQTRQTLKAGAERLNNSEGQKGDQNSVSCAPKVVCVHGPISVPFNTHGLFIVSCLHSIAGVIFVFDNREAEV